jgi:hypothetical protein
MFLNVHSIFKATIKQSLFRDPRTARRDRQQAHDLGEGQNKTASAIRRPHRRLR